MVSTSGQEKTSLPRVFLNLGWGGTSSVMVHMFPPPPIEPTWHWKFMTAVGGTSPFQSLSPLYTFISTPSETSGL
ncbi:hypothetical protein BDR05DRAFT_1005105 [Suillus weaverae]|nr:hypothetical protein BDR05DRAFT_1005105 [Suillus weaverae]